ncbi:MAG: YidB family protein [Parahaliea sp.]
MDLTEFGAQLLSERLGLNVDITTISSALDKLLGKDARGNIDLGALASRMMQNGGLQSVVNSWLGDGANSPIAVDSLISLLGESKVSEFAGTVGTDADTAAKGLSDVLPQMIDNASSGGRLLDAVGGLNGLFSAASSLFKK